MRCKSLPVGTFTVAMDVTSMAVLPVVCSPDTNWVFTDSGVICTACNITQLGCHKKIFVEQNFKNKIKCLPLYVLWAAKEQSTLFYCFCKTSFYLISVWSFFVLCCMQNNATETIMNAWAVKPVTLTAPLSSVKVVARNLVCRATTILPWLHMKRKPNNYKTNHTTSL